MGIQVNIGGEWGWLDVETKVVGRNLGKATENHRCIYLERKVLYAWAYCNELKAPSIREWRFLRIIHQLFWKAKLQFTLAKKDKVHFVYSHDEEYPRPHYPLESDYAATVGVNSNL